MSTNRITIFRVLTIIFLVFALVRCLVAVTRGIQVPVFSFNGILDLAKNSTRIDTSWLTNFDNFDYSGWGILAPVASTLGNFIKQLSFVGISAVNVLIFIMQFLFFLFVG